MSASVLYGQLFGLHLCGMIEQLREYIENNGSYRNGIGLLKLLQHDVAEWHQLQGFCSFQFAPRWAEQRVMALLKVYYNESKAAQSQIVQVHQVKTKRVDPDVIVLLKKEERELMDERKLQHFSLDDTADDLLRADKVRAIREATTRIDEIETDLEAYETTGVVPILAGTQTAAQEVDALYRRKNTLASRICRLNKLLKTNLPLSKKERYDKELREKEAELNLITEKLKGHE